MRDAAERILAGVDDRIAELQATKGSLRLMLKDWDERLARTPANQPARLLDAMGPAGAPTTHTTQPKATRAGR